MTAQIRAFVERYAPLGVHRFAIKLNKTNQFGATLKTIRNEFFNITEMKYFGPPA